MTRNRVAISMFLTALAICISGVGVQAADIKEEIKQATGKFRDLTATVVAVYANHKELNKMGKSYNRSHEFKKAKVTFKEPDKLRMEGTLGMVKVQYIMAGDTRIVRVPSIKYSKRDDVSDDPAKGQSCIDVGVVTSGLWDSYYVKLLATEDTPSGPVHVFHITHIGDHGRHQKLWVDSKFRLLKREKIYFDGKLKSRHIYKEHRMVDGVAWVPFRSETYSPDGVLAGVTELKDVKINQGAADSLFR